MLTIAYIYTVHYEIDKKKKKKLNSRTFILIIHYSESRVYFLLVLEQYIPEYVHLKFEN